jgi:hypothetical protein
MVRGEIMKKFISQIIFCSFSPFLFAISKRNKKSRKFNASRRNAYAGPLHFPPTRSFSAHFSGFDSRLSINSLES